MNQQSKSSKFLRKAWAISQSVIAHIVAFSPGPVVTKKEDETLLNLTGAMNRCSREKVLVCAQKRELESPLWIQEVRCVLDEQNMG